MLLTPPEGFAAGSCKPLNYRFQDQPLGGPSSSCHCTPAACACAHWGALPCRRHHRGAQSPLLGCSLSTCRHTRYSGEVCEQQHCNHTVWCGAEQHHCIAWTYVIAWQLLNVLLLGLVGQPCLFLAVLWAMSHPAMTASVRICCSPTACGTAGHEQRLSKRTG